MSEKHSNLLIEILKFFSDFLTYLGLLVLCGILWMGLNIIIDKENPCSNFSDKQDLCQRNF